MSLQRGNLDSALKNRSFGNDSVMVPLPPRPLDVETSSSEDDVYIESSPESIKSESVCQRSDAERVDNFTPKFKNARKRSAVSFSDSITIIPSDDECEDQIEVEKNKILAELFSDSDDDDVVSDIQVNKPSELATQDQDRLTPLTESVPFSKSEHEFLSSEIPLIDHKEPEDVFSTIPRPLKSKHLVATNIAFPMCPTEVSRELQNVLTERRLGKLTVSSVTPNKVICRPSKPPPLPPKGIKNEKSFVETFQLRTKEMEGCGFGTNSHNSNIEYLNIEKPAICTSAAVSPELQNVLSDRRINQPIASSLNKKTCKPSTPPPLPPKGIKNEKSFVRKFQLEKGGSDINSFNNKIEYLNIGESTSTLTDVLSRAISSNYDQLNNSDITNQPLVKEYTNEVRANEEDLCQTENQSAKLVCVIKDLYESETKYINQLQICLEKAQQLQAEAISEETLNKFFGMLADIYLYHKDLFFADLKRHDEAIKYIPLSFLKHFINIELYIKRQWLVPSASDLDQFESFLLHSRNLKNSLNITKNRVNDYIKKLQAFKLNCEDHDTDCHKITERALQVMENLFYQLEMIEQFKKIEDGENKFKNCGKVHLNCTFEVLSKGSKKQTYLVYLCENLIVFTCQQNRIYRYVDDIPIANLYCITKKSKSKKLELGIKDKKCFVLKAYTETIKDQWCEKLRSMLRSDQFQEQ